MTEKETCKHCGSDKLMEGRMGPEPVQGVGQTRVFIEGDPDALLMKERKQSDVVVVVCADCGYTSLWCLQPDWLWKAHQARLGLG